MFLAYFLVVEVVCGATGMTAVIETSRLFNGKLYPKSQPRSCVVDVVNSLKFEFRMDYNDLDCDVKQVVSSAQYMLSSLESSNVIETVFEFQSYGQYANDIVIQHHDKIVTTQDLGVSIKCQYDLDNKTVSNGFDVGGYISVFHLS